MSHFWWVLFTHDVKGTHVFVNISTVSDIVQSRITELQNNKETVYWSLICCIVALLTKLLGIK